MIADLQTKVIEEAEASGEGEHEVDGMALTPHEHYDYLVVLATTTQEWNVLCERIGLEPEKRRRGSMGTCRAIRASKLIERITPAPAKKKATEAARHGNHGAVAPPYTQHGPHPVAAALGNCVRR
jgi:hypothetical protein